MKKLFLFLLSSPFFILPLIASADVTPSVNSFTTDETNRNSGQFVNLSWNLLNAGGASLLLPCINGIKYANQSGTYLSCGSRISSTQIPNDGYALMIHNFSGTTKTVTLQLIPKDPISLIDYDAGARSLSVTVTTLAEPISSFTTDAPNNAIVAGKVLTFSWNTQIVDGVNLYLECKGGILATSTAYTNGLYLPCGSPIFTTDLPASGSATVSFSTLNPATTTLEARLIPAISPQTYDGTHAKSISLSIGPAPVYVSSIDTFQASTTNIYSGDNVKFSWSSTNVQGANLKISCNSNVSVTIGTSTTGLPCDTYIGNPDYGVSDTVTLTFKSTTETIQPVTVTLVPVTFGGQYDGTKGKNIFIIVYPQSAKPVGGSIKTTPAESTPANPVSGGLKKASIVFTTLIYRGSKGSGVTALQQFLAQDPSIYPEGLVTGFFGPATERAIGRFQKKYGIASPGEAGYGMMGPKTRAAINGIK